MATLSERAYVVSIEVDGRQRYIFETDKLREMLGASRIMDQTRRMANQLFAEDKGLHLFSPVSGEIRAWAEDDARNDQRGREALLDAAWAMRRWLAARGLEHTMAYFETETRHFEGRSDGAPDGPDLAGVHRTLSALAREIKHAKPGVDARPRCSLFASCEVHGLDSANHWTPGERDEERRELVGCRAAVKREEWEEVRRDFLATLLTTPVSNRCKALGVELEPGQLQSAFDLNAMAEAVDEGRGSDQYIAFLCADGDGMGRVLGRIDWNSFRWGDDGTPWQRNKAFVDALEDCVRRAITDAIAEVSIPNPEAAIRLREGLASGRRAPIVLPVLPQLQGGEDIWLIAHRACALNLATRFAALYAQYVDKQPLIRQALTVAGMTEDGAQGGAEPLTLSVGVVFAKAGYPAHAMIENAEELLRSAKRLRKGKATRNPFDEGQPPCGCLDWHWIESSVAESVAHARELAGAYEADGYRMLLTTRPWTIGETADMIKAAETMQGLPRRKREHLESILRLGLPLSLLAWESFWKKLRPEDREVLAEVNTLVPLAFRAPDVATSPWTQDCDSRTCSTSLLDLLAIQHTLGKEGKLAGQEGDDLAGSTVPIIDQRDEDGAYA